MESRRTDRIEERASAETPEDVAVLYSWANLHGAKYRDFSASRREYRAQLRHRASEQVREQAMLTQIEGEAAGKTAELTANQTSEVAQKDGPEASDSLAQQPLREAKDASGTAAAHQVEDATVAETTAGSKERETVEAHASAKMQAERYAEYEIRRREILASRQAPGDISDSNSSPQTPFRPPLVAGQSEHTQQPTTSSDVKVGRYTPVAKAGRSGSFRAEQTSSISQILQRRSKGYSPDDASGVRQIYRASENEAEKTSSEPVRVQETGRTRPVSVSASVFSQDVKPLSDQIVHSPNSLSRNSDVQQPESEGMRHTDSQSQGAMQGWSRQSQVDAAPAGVMERRVTGAAGSRAGGESGFVSVRDSVLDSAPGLSGQRPVAGGRSVSPFAPGASRAVSPFSQSPTVSTDSVRGRRAQDSFGHQLPPAYPDPLRRTAPDSMPDSTTISSQRAAYVSDPAGPAWLYAPQISQQQAKPVTPQAPPAQSSVADTLQHSRERVAARWFALKGVFEQPGQEYVEPAPVRQKETRTPVMAVFSLAGGVGKTSLIATVGRALSSLGEKVLLTDTTSHGLLPFYFGASELRQGTVRTFSPPSGSTDAPIYLVSYDVDQKIVDEASQDSLVEDIVNNSRGTHRILLDLTQSSAWVARHMARMNPTILVPVAPDMNSVISLQAVEKVFQGVIDGDGRPIQPYYLLNQFDASLPLHLDVREVLRRQLGDRLLSFVIRRSPAVSEALAEGMTVVDYVPDSPVSEDYLNIATWLRTIAAPATAGFRNVRWSER